MDGARTEIFLRPLGSPLPLGLAGLVLAGLVVSGLDLGWVPATAGDDVGLPLLARRDTDGAAREAGVRSQL